MAWFAREEDAVEHIRATAEAIGSCKVDAWEGGSDIWNTALLLKSHDMMRLYPFAELSDELDIPGRFSEDDERRVKAALVEEAQNLLADERFWRDGERRLKDGRAANTK